MFFCLQYTLSEETISYLKQPTFDIWHWETNEVRINSSDRISYFMGTKLTFIHDFCEF